MKHCGKCNLDKPFSEFSVNTKARDGRQSHCKTCKALAAKRHYNDDPQRYKDSSKRTKEAARSFLIELKSVPCMDCKISYPYYVMDLDHRSDKLYEISRLASNGNLNLLKIEVAKCDVVCSNCHRERTHQRLKDTHGLLHEF